MVSDLNALLQSKSDGSIDFQNWPIDLLADYIEKKHHRYVEEKTLEIKPYLDKICRVHGERHPELHEINTHFNATAGELAMHMKKEELMVFPFIRKMAIIPKTSRSIKFSASSAPFFISPPARTSLIYIYSCLSRRYSYHTMETTADIFSPCPDIHCPDVYFFQFFSIL